MNEAIQRLLPAWLLTLMLHGLILNWRMTHTPIKLPEPKKISVTLRQPPPPPPPQQKIVKKLPLPPELEPIKQQPLETLPPPQQKILKPIRKIPVVKQVRHTPLQQLPPPQRKVVRRLPKPPSVRPAALRPLATLPPPQRRIVRRRPAPPRPTVAPRLKPLATLPPPQRRIRQRLPKIPAEALAAQPMPVPLETLPPPPQPRRQRVRRIPPPRQVVREEVVWEEVAPPPQPRRRQVQQVRRRQPTHYTQQPRRRTEQRAAVPTSRSTGNQEAAPRYDINPQPSYPIRARRRGLQGTVILKVLVDTSGGVLDLRLASSSGHRILDRAAINSVRGWRFTPGMSDGRPKKMWVRVPVRFALN